MGNILAECRRCSIVDQCELCNELVSQRGGQNPNGTRAASAPASASTNRGGMADGGFLGAQPGQDFQPSNMSEAELIRLAQLRSMQEQIGQNNQHAGGDFGPLMDAGADPALLHAAIAAAGLNARPNQALSEDELMAAALQRQDQEEEARQRAQLREEQSSEYEESLRVDRERQLEKQKKQLEEEQQKKEEDEAKALIQQEQEQKLKEEAEAKANEEAAERNELARVAQLIEEARGRLSDEPSKEEAGRVAVLIRTPEGRALKRAFRSSDPVSQLYDYAISEGGETLASQDFRLITNMPRSVYEDRVASLEVAGLQGQCALLVEIIEPEEPGVETNQPDGAVEPGGE